MILHFSFARKFLTTFLGIAAILFCLIALVDLIDLLRDFTDADVTLGQVAQLVLLKSPGTINEILPLLVLMSTIALFVGLARTSEMVVTRAAGRSALRALVAPVSVALILGMIAVSTFGPLVAAMSNRFIVVSSPNITSATALASSVLPTPVGPTKNSTPSNPRPAHPWRSCVPASWG